MSMSLTWPSNILGGNLFVKRPGIMRYVLICSIDTMFLNFFNGKIFQFHMLINFRILVKRIILLRNYHKNFLVARHGIKFHSQLTWTVGSKHPINSASIMDATMTNYFALFHDINPPAKWSTQPTKSESESEYPITSRWSDLL